MSDAPVIESQAGDLALPERAWGRAPGKPLGIGRTGIVVAMCCMAALQFLGAMRGRCAFPSANAWMSILEALTWLWLASGVRTRSEGILRRAVAGAAILQGATPLVVRAAHGLDGISWTALAAAAVWISIGVGIWRARPWSLAAAAVWALLHYGGMLAGATFAFTSMAELESWRRATAVPYFVGILVMASPFVGLAIWTVLPSTRRHFANLQAVRSGA